MASDLALTGNIIAGTLLPSDIQKINDAHNAAQASIAQTQAQTQGVGIANQQAQQMNPIAVSSAQLTLAQQKMAYAYQQTATIHDQASLDAVNQNLSNIGIDPTPYLPKTYDPNSTPQMAQAAQQKALILAGHYGDLLKAQEVQQSQQKINNDATQTYASNSGSALAPPVNGNARLATPPNPTAPMQGAGPNVPIPGMGGMTGNDVNAASNQIAAIQPATAAINQPASSAMSQPATQPYSPPQASTVQAKMDAILNSPTLSQAGKTAAIDQYKATPEYQQYENQLREIRQEQGIIGADAGKSLGEYKAEADAAGPFIANIQQVLSDSKNFQMGAGANGILAAKSALDSIAKTAGLPTPNLDESVGSQQAFNKGVLQLTTNSLQATGEKSAQAMNAFKMGLPSASMTANGLQQVAAGFIGPQQYKQAQYQAASAINQAGGSLKNFDADFQSHVTPMAFVLNSMSPQNQAVFIHNIQSQPGGINELQQLGQQIKWARSQPWGGQFNFVNPNQQGAQ